MSRIKNKFLELKQKKEKALIAYIMVGYPNEKTTISAINGFRSRDFHCGDLFFQSRLSNPYCHLKLVQKLQ